MINKKHDPDIFVSARESFSGALEVYVYRRAPGGIQLMIPDPASTATSGRITYRWTDPRGAWEPTSTSDVFLFITDFAPQLLAALAEAGVPSPDRSFTEGKLSATEEHLKDMRRLVFKPEGDKS